MALMLLPLGFFCLLAIAESLRPSPWCQAYVHTQSHSHMAQALWVIGESLRAGNCPGSGTLPAGLEPKEDTDIHGLSPSRPRLQRPVLAPAEHGRLG